MIVDRKRSWYGIDKTTSPFGFGCWQIAGAHSINNKPNGYGVIEHDQALEILCRAIENGIDFFDTAQGYNFGKSEQLLGEAITRIGREVVVCTKTPLTEDEIRDQGIGEALVSRVEKSLTNLKTSQIDILLLHNPPDDIDWTTFDYEVLDSLVKNGTIGTYGVSSKSITGAKNVVQQKMGTTVEWVFNLLERRPINDLFPLLEENNMNFIARSPLSRGLLNSKYLEQNPSFNSDDFRSTLPQVWIDWVVDELKSLSRRGIPADQVTAYAMHFFLNYRQVNAFVVGISSMEHLDAYLQIRDGSSESFDYELLNGVPECYPKWA